MGIVSQSSHPHITDNEGAFSLGLGLGPLGPNYVIINYPPVGSSVRKGRIVARINCTSATEPNYMHSFAITEHYFVIIEQPLIIQLKKIVACFASHKPLNETLKWRQAQVNLISVIGNLLISFLFRLALYLLEAFSFMGNLNITNINKCL